MQRLYGNHACNFDDEEEFEMARNFLDHLKIIAEFQKPLPKKTVDHLIKDAKLFVNEQRKRTNSN